VDDLPEIWNESYKKYMGVKIENDSEGVMSDIHWAWGMYGYFQSYALGNMYGAQLLASMDADIKEWREELRKGNFMPARGWLAKNIYSKGNLYSPTSLMKLITGKEPTVKPYLDYLNKKYGELYGF